MITFEEFQKLDIRVAEIIQAEKLAGSEKLVKLQIDLGQEKRQLVAGIGKSYSPEQLIGEQIVVVANLEPKIIKGYNFTAA
jgi:methionyl-tRNA synthetase